MDNINTVKRFYGTASSHRIFLFFDGMPDLIVQKSPLVNVMLSNEVVFSFGGGKGANC